MNPLSYLGVVPGIGAFISGGQAAYNLANAALDPNRDLLPGVTVNNRQGQVDVNPFNNPQNTGATSSSSGGGSTKGMTTQDELAAAERAEAERRRAASTPTIDAATIAGYDTQIGRTQDSLNRLGGQMNTALSNLLGQYNNNKARQQNTYNDNQADYTKNVDQTTGANARKKAAIGDNVRQNVSSLQRLLGAKGAGSSSAAQVLAPYAAARAGTSERTEANETFTNNMNALDTNWNRFRREYDQNMLDMENDYKNQGNSVRSSFAENEAKLRSQLATLQAQQAQARGGANVAGLLNSQTSEINRLLDQIDQLGATSNARVISSKDAAYAAPELASYDGQSRGVTTQASDPTYDETQFYYGAREDDDYLKQLGL